MKKIGGDTAMTRREYLTLRLVLNTGMPYMAVVEAVSSVALANPQWDLTAVHTWDEWEALRKGDDRG